MTSIDREFEIASGLAGVRARIADACRAVGRDASTVRLIAVTKGFPASDVRILEELGCADIGENRDQEARAKRAELPGSTARWHMIGQVQRNKARSIAQWADVVQTVDRAEIAQALSRAAVEGERILEVLIQVRLDPQLREGRGGASVELVPELTELIGRLPGLALRGVMGVAPHPGDAGEAFERLARVSALVADTVPGAVEISAGMSADLEEAIAHGATQVRIGGAILGNRPPLG